MAGMRYLSALLLIGFVGLAVFGVLNLHIEMQEHDSGCIAAVAQGVDCPKEDNVFAYLSFHIETLKNLSTAALGSLLILPLLVAAIAKRFGWEDSALPQISFLYSRLKHSYLFSARPRDQLIGWLALHENSPAAI